MTVPDAPVEEEEVEATEEESTEEEESEEPEADESESVVSAVIERLSQDIESRIDRRVTSLMKTLRKEYGLKKGDEERPEPSQNPLGRRMLKLAIRDEIDAEFDDPKERKVALGAANRIAAAYELTDDDDEDEVAAGIVESVKDIVGQVREHTEAAVRHDLERRGLLKPDDPSQPRKQKDSDGKPSVSELYTKGSQKAKEMFGQIEE